MGCMAKKLLFIILFIIVVLPVPGPPVTMHTLLSFTAFNASLFFSAVSIQTVAVSPLPAVLGSQSYVHFSTAPAVILKPVAILFQSRYSAPVSVLHVVPV